MLNRKIIIVDELIDKAITNICNAALKSEGLPMIASVNMVKDSIKEDKINASKKYIFQSEEELT